MSLLRCIVGLCLVLSIASARADGVMEEVGIETFQTEDFHDELARIEGEAIKLEDTVRFHFALTRISEASWPTLNRVVDVLKAHPEIVHVRIEGHTDFIGTRATNQALSEARAKTIVSYLVSHGVHPDRLSWVGYGEDRPRVEGESPSRRRINRRVEFVLTLQGTPMEDRYPALAEVIYVEGSGRVYTSPTESSALTMRGQLAQGAALETGTGGRVVLRFQDLGRLTLLPSTRVKLVRLDWDPETERRTMAVKLIRGAVELEDAHDSQAVLLFPEGAVRLIGGAARAERRDRRTSIMFYEGEGRVETSTDALEVVAGRAYHLSDTGAIDDAGELPEPPERLLYEGKTLRWTAGEASGFLVEVANDPQFVSTRRHIRMEGEQLELGARGGFVRLRALGADALVGRAGPMIELPGVEAD